MSFGNELKDFVSGFSTGFHLRDASKARQDRKDASALKASGLRSQADIDEEARIRNEAGDLAGTAGPRDTTDTPGAGTTDNTPPSERAAQRYDFAVNDLGYTPQMAAAMVGNASIESGDFDPKVTNFTRLGDSGESHGEFQWRKDRYSGPNGLLGWARQNKLDPKDWKTQWRFADHELKTTHKAAYDGMMAAKTPAQANDAFAMHFEVARGANTGDPNKIIAINKRRAITNNMFAQFASSSPGLGKRYVNPQPGPVEVADLPAPKPKAVAPTAPVYASAIPASSPDMPAPDDTGGADADEQEEPQGYAAGGAVTPAPTMRVYTQPGVSGPAPAASGTALPATTQPWTPRKVGDMPSWGSSDVNPSAGIQQKFRDMLAARAAQQTTPPPTTALDPYGHQAYLNDSQKWATDHPGYYMPPGPILKDERHANPTFIEGKPMQSEYAWQQAQPGFAQWYKTTYGVDPPPPPAHQMFAEGGYVEPDDTDKPKTAIQVGQYVPPTRYRELDPGGAPVRPESSLAWRLEASLGVRQKAMDRLEKRDKVYTEYKPKAGAATPLPIERPKTVPSAAPSAPTAIPLPPERPSEAPGETPAPVAAPEAPTPQVAAQLPGDPLLAPEPYPQSPIAPYTMPARPGEAMPTPPAGAVPPAQAGAPLPQQAIPPTVIPPGVRAVSGYAPAGATTPAYAGQGDATFSQTGTSPAPNQPGTFTQDLPTPAVTGPQPAAPPSPSVYSTSPMRAIPPRPVAPQAIPSGDPLYPEGGYPNAGPTAPVPTPADQPTQQAAKPVIEKGKDAPKGADIATPQETQQVVAAGVHAIQDKLQAAPPAPDQTQAIPTAPPAAGPNPASGQATYAFANNEGALSNDEYKALARQVDPQGKLAEAQRIMKVQHDLFDFYMAKGYPQKAAAASGAVLMYGRRVSQLSGNMAQAAIEAGNLQAAGYWMAKAYETLPDGKELRVGKQLTTEDGKPALHYQVLDLSTGKIDTDDTATADEMMTMAKGLASGALWAKETFAIAQGVTSKSRRGTSGANNQATAEYLTKLNDLGEKIRNTPAGPDRDALVSQYDTLEGDASEAGARVSGLRAARIRWGVDPAKQTEADKKRAITQQGADARQAKLDEFDQQIEAEQDPAAKTGLQRQKFDFLAGSAYDEAARGNKGAVKVGDIAKELAIQDEEVSPGDKTAFMTIGRDFMQANRGDAANAVEVLKYAFDPTTSLQPQPNGKVSVVPGSTGEDGKVIAVGSIGEFFFSPAMLKNIYGIRKAKKVAANPGASAPAQPQAPASSGW